MKHITVQAIAAIITVCAFCLTTTSCCSTKKTATTKTNTSLVGELPSNIDFSTSFLVFWTAFQDDTKGLKSLENYKPSQEIIDLAAVSLVDDEYMLSGYLKTDANFDETAFAHLGGIINRIDETLATFKMPLKNVPEMLKLKGLVSVEAANRVQLRRN